MSHSLRPQDFCDYSLTSFVSPVVPVLYHHQPDHPGFPGGGGGGAAGDRDSNTATPVGHASPEPAHHEYTSFLAGAQEDLPYMPRRGDDRVAPVPNFFVQPNEYHQQQFSGSFHSTRSTGVFDQGVQPTLQHSRNATPDAHHWTGLPFNTDPSHLPHHRFLEQSYMRGLRSASMIPLPREERLYPGASESSPYPAPVYNRRSVFYTEEDPAPYNPGSNSPSPSSSDFSGGMARSPDSSPLADTDPLIEEWLRGEVGIPANRPVALTSVEDYPATQRPPLALKWIMALAIYGSPKRTLTLNGIYEAVEAKFPFYKNTTDKKWQRSMRHSLSLYSMFKHAARPVSESGKGGYWVVVYTPPGSKPYKRQRKRRSGSGTEDEMDSFSDDGSRSHEDLLAGASQMYRSPSQSPDPPSVSPYPGASPSQRGLASYAHQAYMMPEMNRLHPTFGQASFMQSPQLPHQPHSQRTGSTGSVPPVDISPYGPMMRVPGPFGAAGGGQDFDAAGTLHQLMGTYPSSASPGEMGHHHQHQGMSLPGGEPENQNVAGKRRGRT